MHSINYSCYVYVMIMYVPNINVVCTCVRPLHVSMDISCWWNGRSSEACGRSWRPKLQAAKSYKELACMTMERAQPDFLNLAKRVVTLGIAVPCRTTFRCFRTFQNEDRRNALLNACMIYIF